MWLRFLVYEDFEMSSGLTGVIFNENLNELSTAMLLINSTMFTQSQIR